MSAFPYQKILSRMSKTTHSNGDISWTFDMKGLCTELLCITVDFIESPWNAAQRIHAYLCDFGLLNRL